MAAYSKGSGSFSSFSFTAEAPPGSRVRSTSDADDASIAIPATAIRTWHGAEFNSIRCRRPSASASHSAAADDDDAQLENAGTIDRYNTLFGFSPFAFWTQKPPAPLHRLSPDGPAVPPLQSYFIDLFWAACFGWWLAVLYVIFGSMLLLLPWCGVYSRRCYSLARFIVWPFHQRVRYTRFVRRKDTDVHTATSFIPSAASAASAALAAHSSRPFPNVSTSDASSVNMSLPLLLAPDASEASACPTVPLDSTSRINFGQRPRSNRAGHRFGSVAFTVLVCPVIVSAHAFVALVCWALVVLLPMAHMNMSLAIAVLSQPLHLKVEPAGQQDSDRVPLNIVRNSQVTTAGGTRFMWAKTAGIPNLVLNSLAVVAAVAVIPYVIPASALMTPVGAVLYLSAACLTVPPLGYFLCVAITSIASKTSFAFGAILNASFGSIIEIILYAGAMNHADTGPELVAKGIVGAILTALLLIPGLSMIVGGIRHEEQKFNRVSAGVSSMLLLVSLLGALLPTMFQRLFGRYELQCSHCNSNITTTNTTASKHKSLSSKLEPFSCHKCFMDLTPMEDDDVYTTTTWPLCLMIAIILPALYITGLLFTLKTHKHRIDQEEADIERNAHGADTVADDCAQVVNNHDPMNWPVGFSVCVLMACTITFAIISENLNNVLGTAVAAIGISASFAGMTIIAWMPSAMEIVNAVAFAYRNNIALAIEIGTSASVQIAMLQLPILVFAQQILGQWYSVWPPFLFKPVFTTIDVVSLVFSVLATNLLSIDGKTNYFKGACLICTYICILVINFYNSKLDALDQSNRV